MNNTSTEKQIEIEKTAERLAELLKGSDCDYTTIQQVLCRVQATAYPPPTEEQALAQSQVTNACAAQRAVALFRTEAKLYAHEADRTARVLRKLEQSALWLENQDFHDSVILPVKLQYERQLLLAQSAERMAVAKEDEFVKLRRQAHTAIAQLMLQEERQYRQAFQEALNYKNTDTGSGSDGVQAAEQMYKILSKFDDRSRRDGIVRSTTQPIPRGYVPTSSEYLTWLRNEAQKAIDDINNDDDNDNDDDSNDDGNDKVVTSFTHLLQHIAQQSNGVATVAPLKGYERTVQKVQEKYSGDYSKVLDLVRGMIVFDTLPDMAHALELLEQMDNDNQGDGDGGSGHQSIRVLRAKDRLSTHYDASQYASGYRDVLLNICLPTTNDVPLVTELQLHLASFLRIKNDRGHVNYEAARNIHMFNDAFTTRNFLWEPDTDETEIQELLTDIKTGVITNLSLDYSNGLWSHEAKERLKNAFQDFRCGLRDISLRSCRCGDEFILMNVNDEYIATLPQDLPPPLVSTIRLGSLIHEGTAGRISHVGIAALLSYFNDSLRVLDLEGCLDMEWFEACGDDVAETVANYVDETIDNGGHPLPQFQELNLKSTGLTEKGLELLARLKDKVPQMTILHDGDLTKPPRAVGPHRRPAVMKESSAFLRSSQIDDE